MERADKIYIRADKSIIDNIEDAVPIQIEPDLREQFSEHKDALLPSEQETSTLNLVQRHISAGIRRSLLFRTHPIWGRPPDAEAAIQTTKGEVYRTNELQQFSESDPGWTTRGRMDDAVAPCDIGRRALSRLHFAHCNLCSKPPHGTFAKLSSLSDREFANAVFPLFNAKCYAQHLFRQLWYGFSLPLTRPVPNFDIPNYKSVTDPLYPSAMEKAWAKQTKRPGLFRPGDPRFVSPLVCSVKFGDKWKSQLDGSIPKARICLDASREINPLLPKWPMRYTDFPYILGKILPDDCIAKVDLKSWYLNLPVAMKDSKLYSFRDPITNELLRYARVPFGVSHACGWASMVSEEIRRVLISRGVRCIVVYIDDFFIIGHTLAETKKALRIVLRTLNELSVEVSTDKIVGPTKTTDILGIMVDTANRTVGVKPIHILWSLGMIRAVLRRGHVSRKKCYSMVGLLNWVTGIIRGARAPMRALWNLFRRTAGAPGAIRLSDDARRALKWLRRRISRMDAVSPWLDTSRPEVWISDASGTDGWGIWIGESYFSGAWSPEQLEWSVPMKELFPLIVGMEQRGHRLKNKLVISLTDSATNSYSINAGSSQADFCNAALFRLATLQNKFGCDLLAKWLPREFNAITDAMSKNLIPYTNTVCDFLPQM